MTGSKWVFLFTAKNPSLFSASQSWHNAQPSWGSSFGMVFVIQRIKEEISPSRVTLISSCTKGAALRGFSTEVLAWHLTAVSVPRWDELLNNISLWCCGWEHGKGCCISPSCLPIPAGRLALSMEEAVLSSCTFKIISINYNEKREKYNLQKSPQWIVLIFYFFF